MKKLMFALAALAAGTVLAGDQIVSANVVGYAQGKLCSGIKVITPQFSDVQETTTYKLTDLRPQGPDVYNNVFVNRVNAQGGPLGTYMWTDHGGPDWDVSDVWVDIDNNIVTDVKLNRGESLWCQAKTADQSIQSAGQVEKNDLAVVLRDGLIVVGNAFPTKIKMNDIYPTGTGVYNNLFVNRVSETGGPLATYMWTNHGGPDWNIPDVWVDIDNNVVEDSVELEAGEGLWVQAQSADWTLNFPAPEF